MCVCTAEFVCECMCVCVCLPLHRARERKKITNLRENVELSYADLKVNERRRRREQ